MAENILYMDVSKNRGGPPGLTHFFQMGWNQQLEIGRIPKSFLVFEPFTFQVANSL